MMVGGMRIFGAMLVVASLSIVTGCAPSDAPPKIAGLVTVSGVVTLDGKPLPNATVTFVPIKQNEGEMSAGGLSDSTGKYILQTSEKNYGIKPGQYKVIISSFVMPDGTTKQIGADVSPMQLKIEGAKQVVPPQYSDLVGSTLTSNVGPEGGTIDFTLTST